MRLSALGDVAMTIPVVYSVCVGNPDTRFIMITQKVASTLFINTPPNLVVIGVDTKTDYHGVRGMFRLKRELVKEYGIEESRITTDAKGDTEQPFSVNEKNRVVIAIAQ